MVDLTGLGFKRDVFSEAIVTTYNADGSANSAPMGLKLLDEGHLSMNIFNTSSTCRNLKAKKCAAINLTNDIEVYYKSTFKEANPNGKVPPEWFIRAQAVEAPKLYSADATIEVSVTNISADAERTTFSCKVEHLTVTKKFPQVYCRAMPLTLEAFTHATRVKAFINQPQKQKEVTKLTETIQGYSNIVGRVAPNSQYTTILADLLQRIDSLRTKP